MGIGRLSGTLDQEGVRQPCPQLRAHGRGVLRGCQPDARLRGQLYGDRIPYGACGLRLSVWPQDGAVVVGRVVATEGVGRVVWKDR